MTGTGDAHFGGDVGDWVRAAAFDESASALTQRWLGCRLAIERPVPPSDYVPLQIDQSRAVRRLR